jgi:hypothetical protein
MNDTDSLKTPEDTAYWTEVHETAASWWPEKAMECAADLRSVRQPGHWKNVSPYLPRDWHYTTITPRIYLAHLQEQQEATA